MLRGVGKDRKVGNRSAPDSSKKRVRIVEDGTGHALNNEAELQQAIAGVLKCGKDLLAALDSQQELQAEVLDTWKARKKAARFRLQYAP